MKKLYTGLLLLFLLPGLPGPLLAASAVAEAGRAGGTETLEEKLHRLEREFDALKTDHERVKEELRLQEAARRNAEQRGPPHQAAPVGSYGGIMNPDISVVADVQALFGSHRADPNRNKVRVKEVELALQGYLYPGIRADVVPAFEMVYDEDGTVSVEVDLEEAYVTFFQIPYISEYIPLQLQAGRKLMNFGILNAIHPHHWPFADTPLMLVNLFDDHAWYDDGIQGSITIPNPLDVFLKATFGFWNGTKLGHHHHNGGHDHDHDHGAAGTVDWMGHVFLSRTVLGFPLGSRLATRLGHSIAWDEGFHTVLNEADLTLMLRFPGTFRRIQWQNAFFAADVAEGGYTRYGGYSLLVSDLSKNWQAGARYDQAQVLSPSETGREWAGTGFVTYYFTHSLFLRGQYRYRKTIDREDEHNGYVQLVFGLGPHSHRLDE